MNPFLLFNRPQPAEPISGHRYWRINILSTRASAGQTWGTIQEIQFRDTLGGGSVTTGGTAFATTSIVSPGPGNYSPYAAFDGVTTGNSESFWATPGSANFSPCAVGYIFPAPVNIVQISLFSGSTPSRATRMPRDFTVDWSDDGAAWTTVLSVVDAPAFTAYSQQIFTI